MKVLLIGSGGREHALAWKIAQSPNLTQLFTLPGNPGTSEVGINIPGNPMDLMATVEIALQYQIDLAIIGPEDPLAAGLADRLWDAGILVYGPSKAAAQIEASKSYAKDFMARHHIPSAEYTSFTCFDDALSYFKSLAGNSKRLPVIKASGLAAGKGVILPESITEAESALREIMVEKRFGKAGDEVVIEERLEGREVTLLAFTDGNTVVPMPPSQDHKRQLDHDLGLNTGGMGVFAPSPFAPPGMIDWIVKKVIQPAIDGLRSEGNPFIGTIYAGMILTEYGPKTLEFNCRFGDPETQVMMPLLETDILEIFTACAERRLRDIAESISWKNAAAVCVVLASGGYPEVYPKGFPISGLSDLPAGVVAFHAGTTIYDGRIVTNGGRVLGITATAATIAQACSLAYAGVEKIHYERMQYRKDIASSSALSSASKNALSVSDTGESAYTQAGVDIDAGNRAVELMKSAVHATHGREVLAGLGSFGGLFSARALKDMLDPVLVSSTDGVGTKVILAAQAGRYAGIGKDIVNHCINDILVQGAKPLFFMDYFASSKINPELVAEVVGGMAAACREAGCALLGGETAEMPGVYRENHFDVVGTIVGVVERSKLLPSSNILPGDLLIGLASSGPHTNGFSLIRQVFAQTTLDQKFPELGGSLLDALLEPHRSYLPALELVIQAGIPKGLAHITGGGFFDNIPRSLPEGCGAVIHLDSWPIPPLFQLIQQRGEIDPSEMFRVFNMGIGMIVIVAPESLGDFQTLVPEQAWVIGEVCAGKSVILE